MSSMNRRVAWVVATLAVVALILAAGAVVLVIGAEQGAQAGGLAASGAHRQPQPRHKAPGVARQAALPGCRSATKCR